LKTKGKELIQKQVDYDHLETFNRNIIQSLDSGLLTIDLSGNINFLKPNGGKDPGPERREIERVFYL